jgi:cytochrome bd-type quinol oxidase subunit 1
MPYENLNSVFTIIAGFLIFRDSSRIAVGIGILVIIITIGASVNFKKFERPKNLKMILLVQVLVAAECVLTGYFLTDFGDKEYFILYEIIIVAILLIPVLIK